MGLLQVGEIKLSTLAHANNSPRRITVLLGAGSTQMTTPVRWVRFRTAEGHEYDYITSRFDLSPFTIAQLYEARWAIETFFKWLKCTLRMERCL